ncbi:hypothetical protein CPB83DRAFT_866446 [Crepidotus variabilis]|uniref:Protein EFR3 n=1 Tax=Crepidotus variabilis TaxID=179855 RepID=A0A9P6JV60_9AGAR|nr:hypothetical protein CPB83DRAFT_866446 [Crepidotus variabilis]
MNIFTPHHVKLLNSCYPPGSVLLTAGPDYSPNSHELSRLTYYASNHPGKLTKIGSELEKKVKGECTKAKAGNTKSRASLLISLSIFRSLATECRRDIALLSPPLIGAVDCTLASLPSDLEVVTRAATVFTAWTTYTNGQLVGTDSKMTKDYLSTLSQFSSLSCIHSLDQETQNRSRLIGLAAITAALNSEALYNDIGQFGTQVSTILRPLLTVLFDTTIETLEEQATEVKDAPDSPYLAEFRTRPTIERRAASVHIHVDGDKGPPSSDVSEACLRALFSLLSHTNGVQLGYIMQASFDNLDSMQGWTKAEHCCWYAQKSAEWAQYQYRYVVPTWLVERLLSQKDTQELPALLTSSIAMATSVFNSPTPLINLSSSDILANFLSLLLRRIAVAPDDPSLPLLVESISSLGRHVYYSDQIQDLVGELIGRLIIIEVQGTTTKRPESAIQGRSAAIRCILQSVTGVVKAANTSDSTAPLEENNRKPSSDQNRNRPSIDARREERPSRRTRVPADIWQDTLSLLCDADLTVRTACTDALMLYITQEMPKTGEITDIDGISHLRKLADNSFRHVHAAAPHIGDAAGRFLNHVHAYLYILATSPTLGLPIGGNPSVPETSNAEVSGSNDSAPNTSESTASQNPNRRSLPSQQGPKARKQSLVLKFIADTPTSSPSVKATEEDYASILKLLSMIQVQLPMRGLVSGVPMLLALDEASRSGKSQPQLRQRVLAMKTIIAHVWLTIAQVWKISELITRAESAIASLSTIPDTGPESLDDVGVNTGDAVALLTSAQSVQEALGMDQEGFIRRFSTKWTPDLAFRDFENTPGIDTSFRPDGISPLLKISPALMHIENISLQSLARSTRGLGVTDLREALEGRSSMSNPNLARPPSISTLDHTSSIMTGEAGLRLTRTRSRSRAKKRPAADGAGEVRDMLTRLGISKQNSNLLKATFPTLNKGIP